jgi:hypothetical protein
MVSRLCSLACFVSGGMVGGGANPIQKGAQVYARLAANPGSLEVPVRYGTGCQ